MIWNNVAEHANTTYPVKFQERATGFAIMGSQNTMRWKQNIRIHVVTGKNETNNKAMMKNTREVVKMPIENRLTHLSLFSGI